MNRRDLLKSLGAIAALPMKGRTAAMEPDANPAGPTTVETEIVRLKLRHTWTTTMSSSDYRDNLHLRLTHMGITGRGEGAPIVRYREDAESARRAAESVKPLVASSDPWRFYKLMAEVFRRIEGEYAGKA